MRKIIMVAAAVALAATSLGLGASAYARSSGPMTVDITGTNILKVNRSISTTYRFPDRITVRQGQLVRFVNQTGDVHNVTMVREADLPTTVAGVFNCTLCNAVNNLYGGGQGPPNGLQIDNGKLSDDESDHDADTPDPSVPAGVHLPFPVLIQDFNVPSYTGPGHAMTIGDSTIIPSVTTHVGFTARVIQVTVSPGTYHYYCTFHAWMQGTLVVTG